MHRTINHAARCAALPRSRPNVGPASAVIGAALALLVALGPPASAHAPGRDESGARAHPAGQADGHAGATHDDAGAIRHVLMTMFDRPEERLTVEPVVVEGEIAVAGWAQGETGGRALLRRRGDEWRIILCGGDALRQAASLREFGLSPEQADAMAAAVEAAEARLDQALVAKFSLFDGIVMIGEDVARWRAASARRASRA